MNRNIIRVLVATAALLAGAACGKDSTGNTGGGGDYTPKEINVAFAPEELLSLEGSERGEVALTATGKDAADLTASVTSAPEGW